MYTGNPRVTEKINQKIRLKITEIIKTCLENTLLMQNKTVKEEQWGTKKKKRREIKSTM